jgi:hypothetical protein
MVWGWPVAPNAASTSPANWVTSAVGGSERTALVSNSRAR